MSAVIGDVFFRPLHNTQHYREFGGHEVTLVPRNAFQAEHRHLMRIKSGHDLQPPLAARQRSSVVPILRVAWMRRAGRSGNE